MEGAAFQGQGRGSVRPPPSSMQTLQGGPGLDRTVQENGVVQRWQQVGTGGITWCPLPTPPTGAQSTGYEAHTSLTLYYKSRSYRSICGLK